MPTHRDIAICIRVWDFSETSQTVSLFGRDHGVIRGLAKGSKREKGNFSGGIDLLSRGEVVAIVKPGRDLATLTEWDLQEIYWPLRESLAANRAGLYAADLINNMVTDHDPHPDLFDAFATALESLGEPDGIESVLLTFQWSLLRETGYQPELAIDTENGEEVATDQATLAFSAQRGGVVADTGGSDRWRVRRETIELLRKVARGDAGESKPPVDGETVARANRLLAAYIREILGSEPNAMRWAFPDLG